jgi:Bacterial toxin homologue of phage lysozyme, C-term
MTADFSPIDWPFIARQEGGQKLVGYVPHTITTDPATGERARTVIGQSGVTIATAVDLGQWSMPEIDTWTLASSFRAKLRPYAGHRGQGALALLDRAPLTLSLSEADTLDTIIQAIFTQRVARIYDKPLAGDPARPPFAALPGAAKTVIASIAYQYGPDFGRDLPKVWQALVARDWGAAERLLRDPALPYRSRRLAEAELLNGLTEKADAISVS